MTLRESKTFLKYNNGLAKHRGLEDYQGYSSHIVKIYDYEKVIYLIQLVTGILIISDYDLYIDILITRF